MELIFGKSLQRFRNVFVGERLCLFEAFSFGKLGNHAGDGDGGAAAEGLKFYIFDMIVFNGKVYRHHITAQRVAHLPDAVRIFDNPDISGLSEMIHNSLRIHRDLLLCDDILIIINFLQ